METPRQLSAAKSMVAARLQQWTLEPLVGGTIGFGMAKKWLSDGTALGAHLVVVCEQAELDAALDAGQGPMT